MKPRISLVQGMHGYYPSMWWCSGYGVSGVGSNPVQAYESWQNLVRGMQNVYPLQNALPCPAEQRPRWWEVLCGVR